MVDKLHKCIDCGKERLVEFRNDKPRHLMCRSCANMGRKPWNKSLTKDSNSIIAQQVVKQSDTMKRKFSEGYQVWNTGFTKETSNSVQSGAENYPTERKSPQYSSEENKRRREFWQGENNPNWNPNKSEFQEYKAKCQFTFNLAWYPNEFSIEKLRNMWHPFNNNGSEATVRDHLFSIKDGFDNEIDSQIIRHPANCELISFAENATKNKTSKVTVDELYVMIKNWNNKYLLQELTRRFNEGNFSLYTVGGFVRDGFLGRETHDIDMTTDAKPQETKSILAEFGSIYTIGEEFGTIGLNTDRKTVEVTTFRKEVYPTENRKPIVEWGTSLIDDLSRRDFTINSIARNELTREIFDPFNGRDDMKNKLIRVVGGDERFDEDPLRMLRAIRFACELGFSLNIRIEHPERLQIISKERIREELSRILLSRRASYGFRKLCQTGLIYYVAPEFMDLKNIQQGKNHIKDAYEHSLLVLHKGTKVDAGDRNLIFRLACIFHDIGKPETKIEDDDGVHFYGHHNVGAKKARKLLRRLRYNNEIVNSVCHLIKYHMTPIVLQREVINGRIKKRTIMRLVRKVGEDNIGLLMDLVKCDIRSSKNPRYKFMTILQRLVDECLAEEPETLNSPIDGDEIMAEFELKPSKFVGEIKKHLTNLVVDGKLDKDDREGAFAKARDYIYDRRSKLGE